MGTLSRKTLIIFQDNCMKHTKYVFNRGRHLRNWAIYGNSKIVRVALIPVPFYWSERPAEQT